MSHYVDRRTRRVNATAEVMFRVVCGIGGERGWYSPAWMWELRGGLDRLVGGPGMRRGRRDPDRLEIDDTVGFWRVSHLRAPSLVYFLAEMKVPGVASLEFDVEPEDPDNPGTCASLLTHTAKFEPKGLLGRVYWWVHVPVHWYLFSKMMDGLVGAAEKEQIVSAPGAISTS